MPSHPPRNENELPLALAYDDVLLEPGPSDLLPSQVNVRTELSQRRKISLNRPLLSAAMDTVTEAPMAIAMAQAGGLGVIHKNLSVAHQAAEVAHVKRFESGIVSEPVAVAPDMTVGQVLDIKRQTGYSGLPVIANKRVLGIVTNRDLRFERQLGRKVSTVMTPRERLVTVAPGVGLEQVRKLMHQHRIERVIVEDAAQNLCGLITVKDILLSEQFPEASRDANGHLRVAAAVGVNDLERAEALIAANIDALVVDTAHGHSNRVTESVAQLRHNYPTVFLIAGNIATGAGAKALAAAGADAVKVGVGPGSICTTRVVAGIGIPQFSAILRVAASLRGTRRRPGIIADGGIRYSGDIVKALAAGADTVMIGSALAGTEEAPGNIDLYQGRAYKSYRGMGSLAAMEHGSAERYLQDAATATEKLVPEGVEGRVPYKGKAQGVIDQFIGGVRSAMGYIGVANIRELQRKGRFIRVSAAGARESHPHDILINKEAPNYRAPY